MRRCVLSSCWVIATLPFLTAQEPPPRSGPVGRLRDVKIETQDVFSDADAKDNVFYRIANFLHFRTHEEVVARELWFGRGDTITWEQVEELERNLRALHLFGAADAEVAGAGGGGAEVDLLLRTRDRWSLNVGVGLASVGGVEKLNFRLAEGNLFGTGKEIVAVVDRQEDEHTEYVRYTDRQLFGSWHVFSFRGGDTEEGPFADVVLLRPFRHLEDLLSYGVEYSGVEEDIDYYSFGETVAEVPQERHALRLFAARGKGPRELRHALGLDLRLRTSDYGPAFGPQASSFRVPGDTDEVELGPYFSVEWRPRFDEVHRLDAIDYTEDLALGATALVRAAARYRAEDGAGDEVQPVLGTAASAAMQPLADTYVTLAANANGHFGSDGLAGYRTGAALHAFQMSLPAQTLAGSLTFDAAEEYQDLEPQLTLGEDSGLRGYPAREFAGDRIVRLNLEDRIDTGLELLSVHLGAVAFFDAGWVHGPQQGLSFGDAIRSVGVGLRFGSSHLLGSRVARLDVAWPLDDVGGQEYDNVSVSFSIGQVFTFFGNANELGTEF